MKKLIISAHQPNLAPYVGIWRRLYNTDLFDLCPYDTFTSGSDYYCHRVKIGTDDNWKYLSVPLEQSHNKYKGRGIPIQGVPLSKDENEWEEFIHLLDLVYKKYPNYETVKSYLLPYMMVRTNLSDFNISLMKGIRDYLKLSTPICISSVPLGENTSSRVLYTVKQYKPYIYLSGNIGRQYINMSEWNNEGIKVLFQDELEFDDSKIENMKTVSILSVLFSFTLKEVLSILETKTNIRKE